MAQLPTKVKRPHIGLFTALGPALLSHSLCREVYTFGWWMGAYQAPTPKRHKGWCNNVWFAKLDLGVFGKKAREYLKRKNSGQKTVKKYVAKYSGKMSFCGTNALKQTQP